jgi:hypothetical protein
VAHSFAATTASWSSAYSALRRTVYERSRPGSYRVVGKGKTSGGPIVAMTGGVVVIDLRELLDELQARTGVGGRVAARLRGGRGGDHRAPARPLRRDRPEPRS